MDKLAGGALYLFTILTTLAIIGILPAVLLSFAVERGQDQKTRGTYLALAGLPLAYVLGAVLGWNFLPLPWNMSFLDTLHANFADHSIEYSAERVLLFVLMTGSVGAWLYGIGAAIMGRFHRALSSPGAGGPSHRARV